MVARQWPRIGRSKPAYAAIGRGEEVCVEPQVGDRQAPCIPLRCGMAPASAGPRTSFGAGQLLERPAQLRNSTRLRDPAWLRDLAQLVSLGAVPRVGRHLLRLTSSEPMLELTSPEGIQRELP